MAVATVTSAIDHSLFCVLGNLKLSGFIFIKRPKVILLVKVSSGSTIVLTKPDHTGTCIFYQFHIVSNDYYSLTRFLKIS